MIDGNHASPNYPATFGMARQKAGGLTTFGFFNPQIKPKCCWPQPIFNNLAFFETTSHYEAVLKRPVQLAVSHGTLQEIDKLLDALISMSRPVHRSFFWRPMLRDANDDMVLEAALSGHADMLVTFNQRDFEPGTSALGIDVVVPREALKRIKEER